MRTQARKDRAIAHAESFRDFNPFYRSILHFYRMRGDITLKQLVAVEESMERDIRKLNQV